MTFIRDADGVVRAEDGAYYGGWIPPELRTADERDIHDALIGAMPQFKIIYAAGQDEPDTKDADLTYFTRRANGGKHLPNLNQRDVGTCVGHAETACQRIVMAVDIYRTGDLERLILPYEPYNYGMMRVCAGISGRGDGGTGSGAAEGSRKYGILDSSLPGLPKFKVSEIEIDFLQNTDRAWGMRGAPDEWIQQGIKHPIQTVSQITTIKQAIQSLKNFYPIQVSSNWGGLMECPVVHGVRLNRRARDWGHSHHIVRWKEHPDLGNIFLHVNSWGADAHGWPTGDEPPGSFWLQENDEAYILGGGDCYAFSGAEGFPAPSVDWYMGS